MQCLLKNESCRSANFRKTDNCEGFENCELLKAVDSDEPENLKKDDNFDYYILLQPHRVSMVKICSTCNTVRQNLRHFLINIKL